MMMAAIDYSDGIIISSEQINPEILEYLNQSGKSFLDFKPMDKYIEAYSDYYKNILLQNNVAPE